MVLSIVIPHYNINSYRERNLSYTIGYYAIKMPDTPIVVVEQITPDVKEFDRESFIKKYPNLSWETIRTDTTDFMKSALINKAVFQHTDSDYIAMIDNDCILRDASVDKMIPSNDCSIFIPYTSINFLGEGHTRRLIRNGKFTQSKSKQELHISRYTGGINVFSRDTFELVGGFDESFVNWGAEDDAFHIKCKRLVGPIKRTERDIELLHIWHPSAKTNDYMSSDRYMQNKKRVACIKRMSSEDLNEYVEYRENESIKNLNLLISKYETLGRLSIMVKVPIGNGYITMDSTVYDIDVTKDGEVKLRDILECVFIEEGPDFVLGVISQILHNINYIDEFSQSVLDEYQSKCE